MPPVGAIWGKQEFYHAALCLALRRHQALRKSIQRNSAVCVTQALLHNFPCLRHSLSTKLQTKQLHFAGMGEQLRTDAVAQ